MKINLASIYRYCLIPGFVLSQLTGNAQSLGINSTGASANPSSMLDVNIAGISPAKGLLIPRVTSAQRTAMSPLPAAAQGLVVYQTDGAEGFYYNTSTTVTPSWTYIAPGGASGWSLSGNALSGSTANTPNEWLGSSNNYDWIVKTNNTERLRVTMAGKLGINNTNPFSLLDITGLGNSSATGSLNIANSSFLPILFARDDRRVGIATVVTNSTLTVGGEIDITGSRLHVDASSNKVGINMPTPIALLDIAALGSSSATSSLNIANSSFQPILFARDDRRVGIATVVTNSTLTVGGEIDITGSRLHVDASSNKVGINNPTPISLLDIAGLGNSSATGSLNIANSSFQPILFARDDRRVGIATVVTNSTLTVGGEIDITGSRLHVDASSNKVGINMPTPIALLDISGLGNSSATVSLNVANSSFQPILYARDDRNVGIATASPNSTLSIAGSESHAVSGQTGSYTVTASDYCVIFTSSGTNTCTLPAAAGITGRVYVLVNHGTNPLTTSIAYTTASGTTSTTVAIGTSVQLISDGTVWRKIN